MPIKLFTAGETHAKGLINSGKVNDGGSWSFSAEDGDDLLGADGDDWANYASYHLAEDTDETDKTKARWKYPFGKKGEVWTSGVTAAKRRAAQQGEKEIEDAAGRLKDLIDSKQKKKGAEPDEDDTSNSASNVFKLRNRLNPRAPAGYRMAKDDTKADAAEIYIYGPIGAPGWFDTGSISADQFRQDLQALGPVKSIALRINSEGGDVFDAKTMYTLLVEHKAKVTAHIDGLAASAASYLAMAGDEILMSEGAFFMIHKAWSFAMGNSAEMRKQAQLLDLVDGTAVETYAARTRCSPDEIAKMMTDETWMTAKEALEKGFCDRIAPSLKVAAMISPAQASRFRHLPAALRPNRAKAAELMEQMRA